MAINGERYFCSQKEQQKKCNSHKYASQLDYILPVSMQNCFRVQYCKHLRSQCGRSVGMPSETKPRPDQMRKDEWRLFSHLSKTYCCGFAMHTGTVSTTGAPEDAQTQLNNLLFKSPVSLSPFFSLSQDQSDPDP